MHGWSVLLFDVLVLLKKYFYVHRDDDRFDDLTCLKTLIEEFQSSILGTQKISQASYFLRVQANVKTDRDKI